MSCACAGGRGGPRLLMKVKGRLCDVRQDEPIGRSALDPDSRRSRGSGTFDKRAADGSLSADHPRGAPALDCAYKLQEYASLPRRKRSTGKATWPGRKQVWRRYDEDGRMRADMLSAENDRQEGEPLILPVMARGRRLAPHVSLGDIRASAPRQRERLPLEPRDFRPLALIRCRFPPRWSSWRPSPIAE